MDNGELRKGSEEIRLLERENLTNFFRVEILLLRTDELVCSILRWSWYFSMVSLVKIFDKSVATSPSLPPLDKGRDGERSEELAVQLKK